VLQIVLVVLFCVFLALTLVSQYASGASGAQFFTVLWKFALSFLSGGITAFGNIVLVFWIIERSTYGRTFAAEPAEEKESWDPLDLAREPDPDQVKPVESIFAILFLVIGLALFNLYPDLIGMWFLVDGAWVQVPMISETFFSYLPWINLLMVLEIGLHLVLLRRGAWGTRTRIANIFLNLASIGLAIAMLAGPALIELDASALTGAPAADVLPTLSWVFGWLPVLILGILIVVFTVEIVQDVARLVKGKSAML
jgi:hypothetical protein